MEMETYLDLGLVGYVLQFCYYLVLLLPAGSLLLLERVESAGPFAFLISANLIFICFFSSSLLAVQSDIQCLRP